MRGEPKAAILTSMIDLPGAYGDEGYARSLAHVGTPVELPNAGGWVIERPFKDSADLSAPYPLLCCKDWSSLPADLAALSADGSKYASLTAVLDPMADLDEPFLREVFQDHVVAYKDHFVLDLAAPLETSISNHHRREARRGLRRTEIERSDAPLEWKEDWQTLYAGLVTHHKITGPAAFPPGALAEQLTLPGARAYRARVGAETVGMVVWFLRGNGASYHLGATNAAGYSAGASYALLSHSLEELKSEGAEWAHLGAGAGTQSDQASGLTAFKSGWANASRTAYLCGKVLSAEVYANLGSFKEAAAPAGYFPAYRAT